MNSLIITVLILAIPWISDNRVIKRLLNKPLKQKRFDFDHYTSLMEELREETEETHAVKQLGVQLREVMRAIPQYVTSSKEKTCPAQSLESIISCLIKSYPSIYGMMDIDGAKSKRDGYDEALEDWVETIQLSDDPETASDALIEVPAHANCLVNTIMEYVLCLSSHLVEPHNEISDIPFFKPKESNTTENPALSNKTTPNKLTVS